MLNAVYTWTSADASSLTLVSGEVFLSLPPKHQLPEVDFGNLNVGVDGLGGHDDHNPRARSRARQRSSVKKDNGLNNSCSVSSSCLDIMPGVSRLRSSVHPADLRFRGETVGDRHGQPKASRGQSTPSLTAVCHQSVSYHSYSVLSFPTQEPLIARGSI